MLKKMNFDKKIKKKLISKRWFTNYLLKVDENQNWLMRFPIKNLF